MIESVNMYIIILSSYKNKNTSQVQMDLNLFIISMRIKLDVELNKIVDSAQTLLNTKLKV